MGMEYRRPKFVSTTLIAGGNIIFCWFATDKPAAFTYSPTSKGSEMDPIDEQQQRCPICANWEKPCTNCANVASTSAPLPISARDEDTFDFPYPFKNWLELFAQSEPNLSFAIFESFCLAICKVPKVIMSLIACYIFSNSPYPSPLTLSYYLTNFTNYYSASGKGHPKKVSW